MIRQQSLSFASSGTRPSSPAASHFMINIFNLPTAAAAASIFPFLSFFLTNGRTALLGLLKFPLLPCSANKDSRLTGVAVR